jgi:hypothetical protein
MQRIVVFLVTSFLLIASCNWSAYGQHIRTDTIRLHFDQNISLWDYEKHVEPRWGTMPLAMLPLNVPSGMYVSGHELVDYSSQQFAESSDDQGISDDYPIVVQSFDQGRKPVSHLLVQPFRKNGGTIELMMTGRVVIYYDSLKSDAVDEVQRYKSASVLSTGRWLKVAVMGTGVHRITYADLVTAGWNPAQIDPRRLALFGNGGMMLPERNNAFRYDDLVENPIVITGESDGSFDPSDVLYFYGQGTTIWSYNQMSISFVHQINHYSDTTFYFLTELERPGIRISTKTQASQIPNTITDIFLDYKLHENDLENLIHSGRKWYGESFNRQKDILGIAFHFPNRVVQRPVMINTQLAVRSLTETTAFSLDLNGQTALAQQTFLPITSGAASFAREQSYSLSMALDSNDSLNFVLRYHVGQDNSQGWLNYLRVNVWRHLKYVPGHQLQFRNPEAVGFNVIPQYRINQTVPGLWLWDVTDPLRPSSQQYDAEGQTIRFNIVGDSIREFVLFNPADAMQITGLSPIANQNLHGIQVADMIIIAPQMFRQHAETLAALHLQHDGLESVVVCVKEVYNEFSSGKQDITAIRDFIRMVYLRSADRLRYVLLFGDASYDYKDRIEHNTNIIPTYQSIESNIETQSFVSDDYFGLMGSTEGQEMQGVLDLGVGRFPVRTVEEASLMVQKNARYLSRLEALRGPWQNRITFVADDGDGNLHLSQAESLAAQVDTAFQDFNVSKIYLDAYRRIAVPGGFRFPDASAAMLKSINDGSLIVNYTGHGGVSGLTDENVFSVNDIESLSNNDRQAFFVTATCEFSRFDNPSLISAGERLLLNPNGGAIALMTTTRLAFAHSNFNVNRRLYSSLMNEGKTQINRLGDIIRLSKNPTNSYIYNFVLLGNPALRLSYPEYKVELLTINGRLFDTLHAMSEVHIEGRITLPTGQLATNFNGEVQVLMFDKKTTYRTLGNSSFSIPVNFSFYDKLIFRGKATVTNGHFNVRYSVPRSISFNYGKPRISFFAQDSATGITAGGFFDNLILGGSDPNVIPDGTGPKIIISAGSESFKNGDALPVDTYIHAHISDPQGIYFLGTEIGRDIIATHYLPDGFIKKYVLNALFEPERDNPTAGSLQFPLNGLMPGTHRIRLKAWDLHNNSAEEEIYFSVNSGAELLLANVQLSPNPFAEHTTLVFEHNKPGQKLLTRFEVFDVLGNQVYQHQQEMRPMGNRSETLNWSVSQFANGRLPSGVYLWRLIVQAEEGLPKKVSGRMVLKSP